jgi:hypothetical protein
MSFFRLAIVVLNHDCSRLPLTNDLSGLAPGPILLPAIAGLEQHLTNGVGTHLWQSIGRFTQRSFEQIQTLGRRSVVQTVGTSPHFTHNPRPFCRIIFPSRSPAVSGNERF